MREVRHETAADPAPCEACERAKARPLTGLSRHEAGCRPCLARHAAWLPLADRMAVYAGLPAAERGPFAEEVGAAERLLKAALRLELELRGEVLPPAPQVRAARAL